MTLLQSDRQGRESVLGGKALVGARGQEEPHNPVMVLLGCHVEGCETMLRLDVHSTPLLDQNLHNFILRTKKLSELYQVKH